MVALTLKGSKVTRVSFGYEFELVFWPEASLRIGGPFEIRLGRDTLATPASAEAAIEWSDTLAGLFGSTVLESSIDDRGQLLIAFANQVALVVDPNDTVEAYDIEFVNASPRRILCLAGGWIEIMDQIEGAG